MKKLIRLVALLVFCAGVAQAGGAVHVTIKGMVCSFCAQGIHKKFVHRPEVAAAEVNLDEKRLDLTMKDGKDLADEEIRKMINDAGYDVVDIRRGDVK